MDWLAAPAQAGFYHALAKGYYEAVGLDVTIHEGGAAENPVVKVATGHRTFGVSSTTSAIIHHDQGVALSAVLAYNKSIPRGLVMAVDRGIEDWRDLDGQTIHVTPGFPWTRFIEETYDITFSKAPRPQSMAAFLSDPSGKMIMEVYLTNQPFLLEQAGFNYRAMALRDAGYDPMRLIVCQKAFADAHPEVVASFVEASIRGFNEYFHEDSSAGNAEMMQRNPALKPDRLAYNFRKLRDEGWVFGSDGEWTFGTMPVERIQPEADFLHKIGLTETRVAVEQFLDPRFLPSTRSP